MVRAARGAAWRAALVRQANAAASPDAPPAVDRAMNPSVQIALLLVPLPA